MRVSTIITFIATFGSAVMAAAPSKANAVAKRVPADPANIQSLTTLREHVATINEVAAVINKQVADVKEPRQVRKALPQIKSKLVEINSAVEALVDVSAIDNLGLDGASALLGLYASAFVSLSSVIDLVIGLDVDIFGRVNIDALAAILVQLTASVGVGLHLDILTNVLAILG